MLKGLTLTEMAAKLQAQSEAKQDFVIPSPSLKMIIDGKTPKLIVPASPTGGTFALKDLAHNQLGSRLSIPAKYYDRMRTAQPELLAANVNAWLGQDKEKRMVRVLYDNVRAFLSNRYLRVDNFKIAEVVIPLLLSTPGIEVKSCEVTDRRMYIQYISTKLEGKVSGSKRRGDYLHGGGVIANSEVGEGSVMVADLDYFLACLNGMVSSKLMRQSHIGRQIEDNVDLWKEDTMKADDQALILKVRDMVTASLSPERFAERVAKMSKLTQVEVAAKDVTAAVEVLGTKLNATQDETSGILAALIKGGDLSAWGIVNAVTAQAHKAKDYDRSIEFEAAGGKMMEFTDADWTEVLEPAPAPVRRAKLAIAA